MKPGELPNGNTVIDRIEQLEEYISNFPESKLTPIFKEELQYLENLRKAYNL